MKLTELDRGLTVPREIEGRELVWLPVTEAPFALSGVTYDEVQGCFVRMPQPVADTVSELVSALNRNTAGGRVRFRTNAAAIALCANTHRSVCTMIGHMPIAGWSGFDLYRRVESGWSQYAVYRREDAGEMSYYATYFPPNPVRDGFASVVDTDGQWADYVLEMPLYDSVENLWIGLPKEAELLPPTPYTRTKPVVYYGSSITQGGAASRPGNSYQAMISRRLDTEYINLGFASACRAEKPMADYLASLEMSVFVCDYDHNTSGPEHLRETHLPLLRTFREKQPDTPIVIVSAPSVRMWGGNFIERREIIRQNYELLRAEGDRNVHYVDGADIFAGPGWDACTADRTHPNDLGFYLMAQHIGEAVEQALQKK